MFLYLGLPAAKVFGATRGCNLAWNNRDIQNEAHTTTSYATGITGHVEYTRFHDGSQDVKVYPGLGYGLFDSELLKDFDGDGKVDRIRRNGAEWKMNRVTYVLDREKDYKEHRKKFDEADKTLQGLIKEHSSE